jgi:Mrp family chromosome partitioning ATPase
MGPVLIVDANTSSPRQHRLFRQKPKIGLVEVMVGEIPPNESTFATNIESLDIMPAGQTNLLESSRVYSGNCEELFQWAKERYALVLVDLPQIDDLRHGLMIARQATMTLVTVRSNMVRRSDAANSIDRLIADGVKVAGTILCRQTIFTPKLLRS